MLRVFQRSSLSQEHIRAILPTKNHISFLFLFNYLRLLIYSTATTVLPFRTSTYFSLNGQMCLQITRSVLL